MTVEAEFMLSWDEIEQFFDSLCDTPVGRRFLPKNLHLMFIAELRRAGYDRKLRAGASHHRFILTRSRGYGHPFEYEICVTFRRKGTMDIEKIQKGRKEELIAVVPIALSGQVKEILDRLVDQPIT